LALSGGGSRAAVFAAAVMQELERLAVLSQVDVLSAVSGGALPASLYALDGYRGLDFQNGFLEQIGQNFQEEILSPWYAAPAALLRYKLTKTIPAERVIRVLDEKMFRGATFAELNPSRPILLLNSTNALTGEPFIISDENFLGLHRLLAYVSVARAVYMSAAYPGVMEPLPLYDGRTQPTQSDLPAALIYDGGPSDNLGIRTLWTVLDHAAEQMPLNELFPRGCLVISVDATARSADGGAEPLSAAAVLLKSHRRDVLELAGIPSSEQDESMFGKLSVGRGGVKGTCDFWHVALRRLAVNDPLGARVTRLKTNLGLSPDDQAALAVAAARLVAEGRAAADRVPALSAFFDRQDGDPRP
jgi:hypothetical protein